MDGVTCAGSAVLIVADYTAKETVIGSGDVVVVIEEDGRQGRDVDLKLLIVGYLGRQLGVEGMDTFHHQNLIIGETKLLSALLGGTTLEVILRKFYLLSAEKGLQLFVDGPAVQASPVLAPLFTISHNGICIALIIYGFIAAALPVWLLLAPRDYLSTYMKIGTIGALALGILVVGPQIQMPATTQFCAGGGPVITGAVLPYIFVTIACGAISGFHSMISTGTTPKMLMNERSILPVGYGAMVTESFVAMMALIAACALVPNDYFAINSSAAHFQALGIQVVDLPHLNEMVGENVAHRPGGAVSLAVGMAFIFSNIPGLDHLMNYWYHFCIMFEALFIMTIIDAGTRVGRYMLQELIGRVWPKFGDPHWLPGAIIASALISGAWGYIVLQGNLSTIWPIFGVSNQLLAIITLAISTVVICSMGKARFAWVTVIPWVFLTVVIFWADYLNMFNIYLPKQEWLLFIVSAIMALLVIIVSISSIRRCLYLAKTVPPSYDTTETVEAEELKHLEELIKTDPVAKRFKELTVDHH